MVRLEEIVDEAEMNAAAAVEKENVIYEEETDSDDESDFEGLEDETILDRIVALKEIVPVTWRLKIADGLSYTAEKASTVMQFAGKSMWVLSTTALLLGVPFMMSVEDEAQLSEYEKQIKDQRGANEVC